MAAGTLKKTVWAIKRTIAHHWGNLLNIGLKTHAPRFGIFHILKVSDIGLGRFYWYAAGKKQLFSRALGVAGWVLSLSRGVTECYQRFLIRSKSRQG